MEFTLLGAVFVGIVPLYGVLYWEARRGNAASCTRNLWDVALTAVIVGAVVGRIAAMINDGVNPLTHPGDLLIIRGGVATGPATIAALATVAWIGRNELWAVLDGVAAAALAGLGGWHLGCVVRDACLGTPSDLPWAIAQDGSDIGRHPVEIYAALALFLAAASLVTRRTKGPAAVGIPAAVALTVASSVRVLTEPLRPALGNGPVGWYLLGIAVGVGIGLWRWRTRAARL